MFNTPPPFVISVTRHRLMTSGIGTENTIFRPVHRFGLGRPNRVVISVIGQRLMRTGMGTENTISRPVHRFGFYRSNRGRAERPD